MKKRKGSPEEPEGKRKKARTTFTGHQVFELERQFEMKRYLASAERSEMAKLLDVTETQVRRPPPDHCPMRYLRKPMNSGHRASPGTGGFRMADGDG